MRRRQALALVAISLTVLMTVLVGAGIFTRRGMGDIATMDPSVAAAQPVGSNPVPAYASSWVLAVLGLMALTTAVAVTVAARQYRVRRVLLGDQQVVFPEYLAESLDALRAQDRAVVVTLQDSLVQADDRFRKLFEKSSEVGASFLALQRSLDEKDREIRRLKEGQDLAVLGAHLKRFLRAQDALDDLLAEQDVDRHALENARALLADALDDAGVESFSPDVGADYGRAEGVAERPKEVPTDDATQDRTIVEVTEPGYRVRTPSGSVVIRPARVSVAVFSRSENANDEGV